MRIITITTLFSLGLSLQIDACEVSTDIRPFFDDHSGIKDSKISNEKGTYNVSFKNGDVVMAKFETCGIGATAHYISHGLLDEAATIENATLFIKAIISDEDLEKRFLTTLNASSLSAGISESSANGDHTIKLNSALFDNEKTVINYDWTGPELY